MASWVATKSMSSPFWISEQIFFPPFLALGVDVLLPLSQLAVTLILSPSHANLGSIFPCTDKDHLSFSPPTFFHFVIHIAANRTEQPSPLVPSHSSLIEHMLVVQANTSAVSHCFPRYRTSILASIFGQSRLYLIEATASLCQGHISFVLG